MTSFRNFCLALLVSLLFLHGSASAHGDLEKPLFVAENGNDSGDCQDEANPCATLGYALERTGKGGQIRVAAGRYEVERTEDLFHLISGVIDVSGGYQPAQRIAASNDEASVLVGVPFVYREALRQRGFEVVADQKGLSSERQAKAENMLQVYRGLKASIPFTPCVGGNAAGLPCNQVDLLSHVGFNDIAAGPSAGTDVWGFVDLNTGREYALAGFNIGTSVFDVTDATNPLEVGFVDGQNAIWRDIKVYQFFDAPADRWRAYAYVTTDGSTDGLFVIDMSDLPHSISRVNYASDITSAHNVYASNADYGTGLSLTGTTPTLIVAGSNIGNGRYRAYSTANPEAPNFIAGGTGSGYMHDAASLVITDARKDTQCVNGGAHCEVLIDFNENLVEIFDITDSANPVRLNPGSAEYIDRGYVHSGWWSEDKQFMFVHDELDERDRGLPTTLRVFSIADLAQPTLAGTWSGPTDAIDHNGFVRGNRYYMSNYTRGLTVLDITNPAVPAAVGRLDTYPLNDNTGFSGAWGAYPYFHSGNIAISDIDSGFYMAADNSIDVPEGSFVFSAGSFAAAEGDTAQVTVNRSGGSNGAATVEYEILHATADANDYTVGGGALSWPAGDATARTIDITAVNDGASEGIERMLLRLVNPTGGATLGRQNTTSMYVSDAGAAADISFADATIDMAERGYGTIVAVVKRRSDATGSVSVDYAMTGGTATPGDDFTGATNGTLNWAAGDGNAKVIEFSVVDDGIVEPSEFFELTLSNPAGAVISGSPVLTANIRDADGANAAPIANAGASQILQIAGGSVTVTLNGSASSDPDGDILTYNWRQTGGQNVTLSDADSATASFQAQAPGSDIMLQFELTVTDPGGLSDASATTVTILAFVADPGGGSGGGALSLWFLALLGGTLLLSRRGAAAQSSARDPARSK